MRMHIHTLIRFHDAVCERVTILYVRRSLAGISKNSKAPTTRVEHSLLNHLSSETVAGEPIRSPYEVFTISTNKAASLTKEN